VDAPQGQMNESLQQSIVDAMQLFPESGWCREIGSGAGCGIGEAGQTRQVLKGAVATQE
jgi:hypothetical protein